MRSHSFGICGPGQPGGHASLVPAGQSGSDGVGQNTPGGAGGTGGQGGGTFLDDDPSKVGTIVSGHPVLGTTDRLAELCEANGASQVLITMASAPGETVRPLR